MTAAAAGLQALIFDFDGVIVDTEHLHWEAFNQVLAPAGLKISWHEYQQAYMGFDDRGVLQRVHLAHRRALGASELKALIDRKAQAFIARAAAATLEPFPGVIRLIHEAGARVPVGLCTGALASDIDPILDNLALRNAFTDRVTADEVSVSKPDPESYHAILRKLALTSGMPLAPGQCVVIEDTPAGITAAQGAGLRVVAITNSCTRAELAAADWIVASLTEVSLDTLRVWLNG